MKTDELINEENGKALVLHHVISRLERRLNKLANEIGSKKAELQQICIHNELIKKESYIEGGSTVIEGIKFYTIPETAKVTATVCKICGKQLDKQVKYGGFG